MQSTNSIATTLAHQPLPVVPDGAEVATATIELPPGDPGTPPHRHSGPVYGYVTEGAIVFELEGEPERVIRAGEAFCEPGGDLIHYQAGNAVTDSWSRFVVVMIHAPGAPMLTLVDEAELAERQHLRAPRSVSERASEPNVTAPAPSARAREHPIDAVPGEAGRAQRGRAVSA